MVDGCWWVSLYVEEIPPRVNAGFLGASAASLGFGGSLSCAPERPARGKLGSKPSPTFAADDRACAQAGPGITFRSTTSSRTVRTAQNSEVFWGSRALIKVVHCSLARLRRSQFFLPPQDWPQMLVKGKKESSVLSFLFMKAMIPSGGQSFEELLAAGAAAPPHLAWLNLSSGFSCGGHNSSALYLYRLCLALLGRKSSSSAVEWRVGFGLGNDCALWKTYSLSVLYRRLSTGITFGYSIIPYLSPKGKRPPKFRRSFAQIHWGDFVRRKRNGGLSPKAGRK